MIVTNESFPSNLALDSGSTKRLIARQKALKRESTGRLFQREAAEVLRTYQLYPWCSKVIDDTLDYLYSLKDDEGRPYCKSIKRYSDLESTWAAFQAPERDSFMWNVHARRALDKVKRRYSAAHLTMLTPNSDKDVSRLIADWSTSPGFEGVVNPKLDKTLKHPKITKRAYLSGSCDELKRRCREAKLRGTFSDLIIPATRSQASGAFNEDGSFTGTCKMKTRLVNMVSLFHVLAEAMFGAPLGDWLVNYKYSNIGWNSSDTTRWVNQQRMQGRSFLSLDYSKYDMTIPSWLIHSAFEVMRCAFDKYDSGLLDVVEHDFIHKYMLTGDGVIYVHHGNPSGSALTAIINGICNEIITETWLDKFGVTAEFNIMGDDNLIYLIKQPTTPIDQFLNDVADYVTHNFGIVVNPLKCNIGNYRMEPKYLSTWWKEDGPYRPIQEVIAMLTYGERRREFGKIDEFGHQVITPELLVYSMIISYPATMRRFIDVPRFMIETKLDDRYFYESAALRREIPYALRVRYELALARQGMYYRPRQARG